MGKALAQDLVLLRSKCDKLSSVKNLNLWGSDIDDVRILREMPNVEVLSLSVNKITSLKEFAHCTKLTELYLRKNAVSELTEVKYLQNLGNLRVLWLWDNPCAENSNYREYIIKTLPYLQKLDNTAITPEERQLSLKTNESHQQNISSNPTRPHQQDIRHNQIDNNKVDRDREREQQQIYDKRQA
jgi:hypothetical protein